MNSMNPSASSLFPDHAAVSVNELNESVSFEFRKRALGGAPTDSRLQRKGSGLWPAVTFVACPIRECQEREQTLPLIGRFLPHKSHNVYRHLRPRKKCEPTAKANGVADRFVGAVRSYAGASVCGSSLPT